MSPRIADLGYQPFAPGPTLPPPTGPGTGDGGRPAPQVTPITVRVKRCCKAVLVGEKCDCRNVRRQATRRPAIVFTFGQVAS